jgi:hypothetical protein
MSKVIIFQGVNGLPSVLSPSQSVVDSKGIKWVADKDIPGRKTPYWVVDASDLPSEPQELWTIDTTVKPTGETP